MDKRAKSIRVLEQLPWFNFSDSHLLTFREACKIWTFSRKPLLAHTFLNKSCLRLAESYFAVLGIKHDVVLILLTRQVFHWMLFILQLILILCYYHSELTGEWWKNILDQSINNIAGKGDIATCQTIWAVFSCRVYILLPPCHHWLSREFLFTKTQFKLLVIAL